MHFKKLLKLKLIPRIMISALQSTMLASPHYSYSHIYLNYNYKYGNLERTFL